MRRALFLLAASWLASFASATCGASPNFVVFICDDLGCLDIEPYGGSDVRTPNMQRLAERGLVFSQAFVASPSCAPSRAALLTGLMPARNGAEDNHSRPRKEIKKLPAYLQELGYEVAAFGKVAHYNHGPEYGFDQVGGEGFQKHEGIGQAVELLKTRKKDKPLCLFVGTNWPHVPWPEGEAVDPAKLQLPAKHVDTLETRKARARYYAAVANADEHLGKVLNAADESLDPANTYFFFTSDHGAQVPFGKWNLYDTGTRVPLIVRGPGIQAGERTDAMVSWVDLLPTLVELGGGRFAERLGGSLALRNAPAGAIDGRSFAGVLRGERETHRDEIFTTHSGDREFNVYPMRSVRDGRWKYILNLHPEFQYATHINRGRERDGRDYFSTWEEAAKTDALARQIVQRYKKRPAEELYDLQADPHEERNLAGSAEHAERLAAMRAKGRTWMTQQGDQRTVFHKPLLLGEPAIPRLTADGKAKSGK
jgi:N-sulfoglucosamine sulfohydrolase